MQAALSIDLEAYWHHEWLRTRIDRSRGDDRVREAVGPLLELLAGRDVRATFFVVGELIDRYPALMRRIAAAGHELACHTHTHRPLWEMTPEDLDGELTAFAASLSRHVPGQRPAGFRAPTFSLAPATAWALDVLARHGYRYDSSVFPLRNPIYGVSRAPTRPYRPAADLIHRDASAPLVEWPMTVWELGPLRLPVCGGIYLRLLPLSLILRGLRAAARRGPVVVFLHPWELDPDLPRLDLPLRERFVIYHNTGAPMRRRLQALLDQFEFSPMVEILKG